MFELRLSSGGIKLNVVPVTNNPKITPVKANKIEIIIINGVLITQAAAHLKYLGEITIEFKNGKIISKSSRLIELNKNGSSKAEIKQMFGKYEQNSMFAKIFCSVLCLI